MASKHKKGMQVGLGAGVRGEELAGLAEVFGRAETLVGFGAALRRRREHLGMTLDGLAAVTGISKPYLSNIETARAPGPPSEEKLERMAEALGLERGSVVAAADWLRTPESVRRLFSEGGVVRRGDGAVDLDSMLKEKPVARSQKPGGGVGADQHGAGSELQDGVLGVVGVPVINKVAAGLAAEFTDMDYPAGVADAYVPMADFPEGRGEMGGAFAVRVSGDSMEPEYVEGETVVVGGGEAADGDDCVVRLGEAENFAQTLKRVFFVRDGGSEEGEVVAVRLVPLNGKYAERVVGVEGVSGVYPVLYKVTRIKGREGKGSKGTGMEVRSLEDEGPAKAGSEGRGTKGRESGASGGAEGGSPPTGAEGGDRGGSSGFSLEND